MAKLKGKKGKKYGLTKKKFGRIGWLKKFLVGIACPT